MHAKSIFIFQVDSVKNRSSFNDSKPLSPSTETLLLKRVVRGPGSLYRSELCINSNVRIKTCRISAPICVFGIKLMLPLTARGDLLGNVDLTAVVGMCTDIF